MLLPLFLCLLVLSSCYDIFRNWLRPIWLLIDTGWMVPRSGEGGFCMNLPDSVGLAFKVARRSYGCAKDADTHLVTSRRHRRAISLEKQSTAAVGMDTVLIPGGDDP